MPTTKSAERFGSYVTVMGSLQESLISQSGEGLQAQGLKQMRAGPEDTSLRVSVHLIRR